MEFYTYVLFRVKRFIFSRIHFLAPSHRKKIRWNESRNSRSQIRYVRKEVSMGNHGNVRGRMVAAPRGRMRLASAGGSSARRYINRPAADHDGETKDHSRDRKYPRASVAEWRTRRRETSLTSTLLLCSDNRAVPGRVRLETWQGVFEIPRVHVRRYMGGRSGYTTGGEQDNALPSRSDHIGL